jgi:hypothetical protein
MAMLLVLLVTVSAAANWRGGWTVGPRYLGAAPPFLAFGAVVALEAFSGNSSARRALARALAGGLMLASVAQTGLVSLVYNSVPEAVTRPLPQFAWPLLRAGFVPHHAGELVGLDSPAVFYGVLASAFAAVLVAAFWPAQRPASESLRTYGVRVLVMGIVLGIGLRPALSKAAPGEGGDGAAELRNFVAAWEPPGRDFVTTARRHAAIAGPNKPCVWKRLARLERVVRLDAAAVADEAKGALCP